MMLSKSASPFPVIIIAVKTNDHVSPTARSQMSVENVQSKLSVRIPAKFIPESRVLGVSVMEIPIALLYPEFPYVMVYSTTPPLV